MLHFRQHFLGEQFERVPPRLRVVDIVEAEHEEMPKTADIMVDPDSQGLGMGKALYAARDELLRAYGLLRIRAGARLQGYHLHRDTLSPEAYVLEVVAGRLSDPTLTFQLKRGFKVLGIAAGYMRHDPMSLGFAAVIEYLNPAVATPDDYARQRRSPYFA